MRNIWRTGRGNSAKAVPNDTKSSMPTSMASDSAGVGEIAEGQANGSKHGVCTDPGGATFKEEPRTHQQREQQPKPRGQMRWRCPL